MIIRIISFMSQSSIILTRDYINTRSLGALQAPASGWRPFGPLDFVLHGLHLFRPCDPEKPLKIWSYWHQRISDSSFRSRDGGGSPERDGAVVVVGLGQAYYEVGISPQASNLTPTWSGHCQKCLCSQERCSNGQDHHPRRPPSLPGKALHCK